MKRAPKVFISLLLLVTMLCNLLPAISLVSAANASDSGFSYKLATVVTPGKEYLVLNTSAAGTAYALAPGNGANDGNLTSSKSIAVTVNADGTVSGSDATKSLEWEFVQSVPANGRSNLLFMLQNKSTGAYLWNPIYDVDTNEFGTCITPVQDAYNGGTMAVFNFNSGHDAGSFSENLLAGFNGTPAFQGAWLRLQSPASGDGHFTINFGRTDLSCDTWRYMAYTYHDGSADNASLKWPAGKNIGVFTNTTTNAGPNPAYYYNGVKTVAGWNSPSIDLYASISGNGYRGTLKSIRIDPIDNSGDGNLHGYIDSVILGKTVAGIQTISAYRKEVADRRGGGLMPSVEYPFCQFTLGNLGGGKWSLGFYSPTTNNLLGYNYMIAPEQGGSAFRFAASTTGVYLFEKVYDAGSTEQWVATTEFENGEDFAIVSVNNGTGKLYNSDGTTIDVTIVNGVITSSVPASATWSAYANSVINGTVSASGQNGYWLSNNVTRNFLITNSAKVVSNYAYSSDIGNYYGTNLCNYVWNYEGTKLVSTGINKSQVVGASSDSAYSVAFNGNSLTCDGSGSVYIFKKTYHEHNYVETGRVSATCTASGQITYTCECGVPKIETIPATGHSNGMNVSIDNSFHGYSCSVCGEVVKTAHSIVYSNNNDDKTHTISCTGCNYSVSKNHTISVVTTEPDCTHPTITTTSCSLCGYEKVEQGTDLSGHKPNCGSVTAKAGCETSGTLTFSCLVCGQAAGTASIEAHGHMYSDWYSNVNGTKRIKKCLHCGDKITEDYSNFKADYVYALVDVPVAGRDYIIANTAYAGSGFAAASANYADASNEELLSTPITINAADSFCSAPYINANSVGSNIKWTAEKNGSKFAFRNNETNEYFWARTMTDSTCPEWIHKNVGSSAAALEKFFTVTPASISNVDGTVTSTGVGTEFIGDNGIQVGFRDNIFSNGFTIPGKNALRFEESSFHYPILSYVDTNGNLVSYMNDDFPDIDGNCVIDLDFSFSDENCCLILYKPDHTNGLYGQRIEILGGAAGSGPNDGTCVNFVTNVKDPETGNINCDAYLSGVNLNNPKFDGTAVDGGLSYGYNVWHHLRIVCDEETNSTDVYIDNVHIAHQEGFIFDQPIISEHNAYSYKGIYMLSWISNTGAVHKNSGMPMRCIAYPSTPGWNVWVDNLNVVTDEIHIYDDYDDNRNAFYGADSSITADFVSFTNPTVVAPEKITENVFVANHDDSNKVYLYEKNYKYTVEYYFDGVIDESLTDVGYASVGSRISYTDKCKFGYKFSSATPAGTITVSEDTSTNVIKVYYVTAGAALDDSVAVSFANTSVPGTYFSDNDTIKDSVTGYTLTGIASAINGSVNTIYDAGKITNSAVITNGVAVTFENGNVVIRTERTTDVNCEFYLEYTFTINGKTSYIYSKAKVISATSIYFEDNSGFVTYENGTLQSGEEYGWESVGSGNIPVAVYNSVYGYSDTYNNAAYIQYSGGSSYKLTMISSPEYENGEATATFAFKGTGFDVLSHADSTAGIIFVDVYEAENGDPVGEAVRSYFVNNYLGYTYENGEWKITDNADAIYQIPTIKVDGLAYGEYVAVITPTYAKDFKGRLEGDTNFYLDAIRIYDPMAESDEVNSIYAADSQYAPTYYDIGELIINSIESDWNAGCDGIMYITTKSGVTEASDYIKFGPNHEVYLESTDYITFYLTAENIPDMIVIGASAIGGTATLTCAYGTAVQNYTLNSATDMYYTLENASWSYDSTTGLYKTNEAYTITAKSGTVSLSDIRITTSGAASSSISFMTAAANDMEKVVDELINMITVVMGDINGDNRVTAHDSIIAKMYMTGSLELSEDQIKALDINGDGRINSKDMLLLKKMISGK